MRTLILATVLLLAPATAHADTKFKGSLAGYMTKVAKNSRMPQPTGTIQVTHGQCPGFRDAEGCTDGDHTWLPHPARFAALHELGHVYDDRMLQPDDRLALIDAMGKRRWMPEQFADAYALCGMWKRLVYQVGAVTYSRSVVAYGWQPSQSRHRRVCAAISRTVKHHGPSKGIVR